MFTLFLVSFFHMIKDYLGIKFTRQLLSIGNGEFSQFGYGYVTPWFSYVC